MIDELKSPDIQWAERCSYKLDLVLTRLDNVVSLLFYNKAILTSEEAAMYIGMTKSNFYKVVRRENIKYYRPTNGKKYFMRKDIDEWMKSRVSNTDLSDIDDDESVAPEMFL